MAEVGRHINSKPTRYKGVEFRSKFEAGIAAKLDANQMPWEYEPVMLDGYIPDFRVNVLGMKIFAEAKPLKILAFNFTEIYSKIMRAQGGDRITILTEDYSWPKGFSGTFCGVEIWPIVDGNNEHIVPFYWHDQRKFYEEAVSFAEWLDIMMEPCNQNSTKIYHQYILGTPYSTKPFEL